MILSRVHDLEHLMFFCCFQDSHFSDFVDKQTKYTTKCMVTAPVMSGKEPIGVIMALNKQGAEEFSKSDQEVSGQDVHW